jgi:hypothetical protein
MVGLATLSSACGVMNTYLAVVVAAAAVPQVKTAALQVEKHNGSGD